MFAATVSDYEGAAHYAAEIGGQEIMAARRRQATIQTERRISERYGYH